MHLRSSLRARHPRRAARTAAVLAAGAIVLLAYAFIDPATPTGRQRSVSWLVALLATALAAWCWLGVARSRSPRAWARKFTARLMVSTSLPAGASERAA